MSETYGPGPSIIEQLAAWVARQSYDALPEAAVRAARRAILDTVGVTLAGAPESTAAHARAMIAHRKGDEATVIGTTLRASVEDAALVNGTASHVLDYDDVQSSLSGHPSVPVLAAAFALAEREHASGQALITAFIAGVEVEAKLGRAVNPAHYEVGWHATSALGVFGAAAAAASVLRLSAAQTTNALAIAASMASGVKANFGTDGKSFHVGHAARCGLEAAFLAKVGFVGNPRALEHVDGFGSTHGGGAKPNWELTVTGLGDPYEVVEPGIGVKRYPACASTHQALDATLALKEVHKLEPAAIAGVECGVYYLAPHQLIYDHANTGLQGKFSMAYCVSAALVDGQVGLAQFDDARVQRADVQAFMPKVRMFVHPEQTTRECLPTRFSEVTITLADGRKLTERVQHAKGQPKNPISDADLDAKFRDCAVRALPRDRAEQVLASLRALETVKDVATIAAALATAR